MGRFTGRPASHGPLLHIRLRAPAFVQVLLCDLTPFNKHYRRVGARRVLDAAMERVSGSERCGARRVLW